MLNFDCGIYCITAPSGKMYIGQTHSFRERWGNHLRHLRSGKHACKELQDAFQECGESALIFSMLAIVPIADLNFREQEQIEECPSDLLLNCQKRVSAPRRGNSVRQETRLRLSHLTSGENNPNWGVSPSAEQREKLSLATRLVAQNEDWIRCISRLKMGALNPNARAVLCVETSERFESLNDAVRWLKANGRGKASNSSIVNVCKGRGRTAYGYTWRYADQQEA